MPSLCNALNEQAICQQLDAVTRDRQSVTVFKEISSTHGELLNVVKKGISKQAVYLAEYQSAGKGRRGRAWQAPAGKNISLSASYHYHGSFASLSGLSLAVAVMVLQAIASYGLKTDLQLKWPNDIYAEQKKLGGILIDIISKGANQFTLIVSLGLNVNLDTADLVKLPQAATSLQKINQQQALDRNRLSACLINVLADGMQRYQQCGFAAFKQQWESHHFMRDQSVTISDELGNRVGICRGIDDNGSLIIEHSGHLTTIHSGDVSLRLSDQP